MIPLVLHDCTFYLCDDIYLMLYTPFCGLLKTWAPRCFIASFSVSLSSVLLHDVHYLQSQACLNMVLSALHYCHLISWIWNKNKVTNRTTIRSIVSCKKLLKCGSSLQAFHWGLEFSMTLKGVNRNNKTFLSSNQVSSLRKIQYSKI